MEAGGGSGGGEGGGAGGVEAGARLGRDEHFGGVAARDGSQLNLVTVHMWQGAGGGGGGAGRGGGGALHHTGGRGWACLALCPAEARYRRLEPRLVIEHRHLPRHDRRWRRLLLLHASAVHRRVAHPTAAGPSAAGPTAAGRDWAGWLEQAARARTRRGRQLRGVCSGGSGSGWGWAHARRGARESAATRAHGQLWLAAWQHSVGHWLLR